MAVVTVAHHPELTPESAIQVFRSHFADAYDVYAARGIAKWFNGWPHFVVRASSGAVGVRLIQKKNSTSFRTAGMTPPVVLLGVFFGGIGVLFTFLIAWLALRSSWADIEADIASVIERASEFN